MSKRWMSQGTKSILFGCHNPIIHTICVARAWKKLYGHWPAWWQFVCIVIHDIGHWGLDYLDNYELKKQHWELGAIWAEKMFGEKGFFFVAGHCKHSGLPLSPLYKADKYSWHLAPVWWLILNNIAEPELRMGFARNIDAVRDFKAGVAKSVSTGNFTETHKFFLERKANVAVKESAL